MSNLPLLDVLIIIVYLVIMMLVGFYFSRKKKSSDQFTKASGKIPMWAVGLSIYATFLSSNTFIGVPGKAYGSNWNAFVFSISLPLAAWVASKYFIPFYRRYGGVSAYSHLEHRFGPWARTYAVICFLLTQLARMGSIFFGIALTLQALTGFDMAMIMLIMGICIIVYTVVGGMEAVIWTEVVQAILITVGALLIIYLIIADMPGGVSAIIKIGQRDDKFSLGSFTGGLDKSTFWVILLYGFFINLNNFGMDQNYVQRYHTAKSSGEASKSVWLSVWFYVPVSFLFFIIGTCLYAYYQVHPELLESIRYQTALSKLPASASPESISQLASTLSPSDYGDKVVPHFMVSRIPAGMLGLIISAILAAAMSTISSGMNASATVFTEDIYKRYLKKDISDRQNLKVLRIGTVAAGLLGMGAGVSMIGIKSILDIWWQLSGIFAGGILGLFLLGIAGHRTKNVEAVTATIIGLLVILWMTFSNNIPEQYAYLRSPFHIQMVIVVGTLVIFLSGLMLTRFRKKEKEKSER